MVTKLFISTLRNYQHEPGVTLCETASRQRMFTYKIMSAV